MNNLRTFYFLVITQTLSIIGSRMTGVALGIRVYTETGNAAPLLLFSFFNELPAMLGSSFAGVFVDRWNRKRVLVLSDSGQALGSLLLLISFSTGQFQLWHLYTVAVLQGICAMFQSPAKDAVTTMLVPDENRDWANAVQAMSFPLAGVVAPALAGLIYVGLGISGVILIDLLTFTVAVLALTRVDIPQPKQSDIGKAVAGSMWNEWGGGLRYLSRHSGLLTLVLYFTMMNFLLNGPLELTTPYVISITGSEAMTGFVLATSSFGGFVGAGLLAWWGTQRSRVRTVFRGMLLVGLMFLVYGTARTPVLLALAAFGLMLPLQTWAIYTSILQAKIPPDIQGRVFALVSQLGYVGATVSFLLVGPLVDNVLEPNAPSPGEGIGWLLVGTGFIILLMTVGVYALPAVRGLETPLPDYEAEAVGTAQQEA